MRAARWVAALAFVGVVTGCSGDGVASTSAEAPSQGGPRATPSAPPAEPMDRLEQPIADRLAGELRDEGLTLQHVSCPPWAGDLPAELTCEAYVDGVVGRVRVELTGDGPEGAVEFDAWLEDGVVATAMLVERLEDAGFTDVDCGDTPAYPARVGLEIVCEVTAASPPGETSYVVATVTDVNGAVTIEDY